MNSELRNLPIDQRIRLVEDLWDSISADQNALPLTDEQKTELDRRLDAYEASGAPCINPQISIWDLLSRRKGTYCSYRRYAR